MASVSTKLGPMNPTESVSSLVEPIVVFKYSGLSCPEVALHKASHHVKNHFVSIYPVGIDTKEPQHEAWPHCRGGCVFSVLI